MVLLRNAARSIALYRQERMVSWLLRKLKGDPSPVSPRGPVFISYRHSDGAGLAIALAWALRAAGVPVWLDRSDLPPGDTERRLEDAMQSGLSGAVLLVTPDIGASSVIKDIELPQLLGLEAEGAFTLSIASTIETEAGGLDYSAPDRLLSQSVPTLKGLRQDPALTSRDIADIARSHCRQRMEALRESIELAGQVIDINLQTRIVPSAIGPYGDLVLRLRPPLPGDRRPHRQGLNDLRLFLGDLSHLLEIAGARRARVSGGAHLSVAFALGAALPTTLLGDVDAVDTAGHTWTFSENAPAPSSSSRLLEVTDRTPPEAPTGDAIVFMDLLPTRSDPAFDRLLEVSLGGTSSVFHIRPVAQGNLLPEDAGAIVQEASHAIRQAVSRSETSEVHLLLRCPWTVALLLGRTLNTIRVNLYEWEDGPDDGDSLVAPRYLPSLVVRSGAGGSPIERVMLPMRQEASAKR